MRRDQLVKKYHLLWSAADMLLREIGGDADYTNEIRILESIQNFALSMVGDQADLESREHGVEAALKLIVYSYEAPEPVPQWDR